MLRSRRYVLGLLLALLLVAADPPQLDLLRYPVALVVSWPARAVAAWFEPEGRDLETMTAQAAAQNEIADTVFRSASHFPVFHTDEERRRLFLVGGFEQGIAQGDKVVLDDQFLGFVDLVESRWSRVRVLGHPDLHLGGEVRLEGDRLEPGVHQQLLLSGSGGDGLLSRQGSRIAPSLSGLEVWTIEDPELGSAWRLGRIDFDSHLDTEVVRVDIDLAALDEVEVRGRRPRGLKPRRDVEAVVLAHGGGGTEIRNWLLGRGSSDGIRVGAWVSAGGVLVGRIVRCGLFSSRMLALPDTKGAIAVARVRGEELEREVWQPGEEQSRDALSRGRSLDVALPRGLLVPASGRGGWPATGETLTIHVADDLKALLRLGAFR